MNKMNTHAILCKQGPYNLYMRVRVLLCNIGIYKLYPTVLGSHRTIRAYYASGHP